MSKTILVTGAAGFIGAALCNRLSSKKSDNVVAVVSPYSDTWRLNKGVHMKVKATDLRRQIEVNKLFKVHKPDIVVHLASHGVYRRDQNDQKTILLGNYEMTLNLLEASSNNSCERFINAGSVFEYGTKFGQLSEHSVSVTDILNDYAASKIATTALCAAYYQRINVLTLRYFTAYGPKEDESRFISFVIDQALNNQDIIVGKGLVRDYVYIDDVIDATLASINSEIQGEVINIGSGMGNNLDFVADLIISYTKSKSKISFSDVYVMNKYSRCWADVSKAKSLLKWEPKVSLENGIRKTVEWRLQKWHKKRR